MFIQAVQDQSKINKWNESDVLQSVTSCRQVSVVTKDTEWCSSSYLYVG